jgi:hypothetical protein
VVTDEMEVVIVSKFQSVVQILYIFSC